MTEFVARLPELKAELAELERRAEAIRLILSGVAAYTHGTQLHLPDFIPTSNGNANANGKSPGIPRGRAAVKEIVATKPGTAWSVKQIIREFKRREWPASSKAIEVAVHRLARDGEAERVRPGVYRFQATEELLAA